MGKYKNEVEVDQEVGRVAGGEPQEGEVGLGEVAEVDLAIGGGASAAVVVRVVAVVGSRLVEEDINVRDSTLPSISCGMNVSITLAYLKTKYPLRRDGALGCWKS